MPFSEEVLSHRMMQFQFFAVVSENGEETAPFYREQFDLASALRFLFPHPSA